MSSDLKTFWLNLGFVDTGMDLSGRRQILCALAKEDVEVRSVFNYIEKPAPIRGLAEVWMLQLLGKGLFGQMRLFVEQQLVLMKNLDVDVVVLRAFNLHQTLPLWFLWRKVLRRKRPKFILDVRTLAVDLPGNWRGKLRQWRFDSSVRIAFRYFEGLTMITQEMKRNLQTHTNNFEKKICVWSTGADPSLFAPDDVSDLRADLGLQGRFVVMYHGVLSPNRGLQQAIEAIAILRKSHPEVMFFLLGKGTGQGELEQLVTNLDLQKHVRIHPPVPFEDVPKYIKSSQVGILPFPDLDWWNTSGPLKLGEYLAMGRPVIVTDIAAHRAVLNKSKFGFFVPDHEPISLATGIKAAIEMAPELTALGEEARKLAVEQLTWEKQARKIKRYFKKLLN